MGEVGPDSWLTAPRSRAALRSLDGVLERSIAARDVQFGVMARHLLRRRGKRLRPALALLAGEFGSFPEARLLKAAAALELLHVASLYHDDIVDEAPSRRGIASANDVWGAGAAALAGTYLFARAVRLFADLGPEANRIASAAVAVLCAGQLAEVENAYNAEMTEEDHLDILRRKTATLFELPAVLGARLAGSAESTVDALARYGRHLGLAFQLVDDSLDLTGDSVVLGKDAGTDLRQGIYSLAVLRALHANDAYQPVIATTLALLEPSSDELGRARAAMAASGAVQGAMALARTEQDQALAALADLPAGPVVESLQNLATLALVRTS